MRLKDELRGFIFYRSGCKIFPSYTKVSGIEKFAVSLRHDIILLYNDYIYKNCSKLD